MRSFADERAHTEGGALRFLSRGPWSFRAEYDRDVSQGLARSVPTPPLTEADLAQLPAVVQRYIRLSGALGCRGSRISRPAITDKSEAGRTSLGVLHRPAAQFLRPALTPVSHGRLQIRDPLPGVPPLHRAVRDDAGQSRIGRHRGGCGRIGHGQGGVGDAFQRPVRVGARRAERPRHPMAGIDRGTVEASFTNAGRTIRAVLSFNEAGELANFVADGRGAASADGKSFTKMRWSTPLSAYHGFGAHRLMGHGEGIWHAASGDYSYGRPRLL
jgi:hypothetical protein